MKKFAPFPLNVKGINQSKMLKGLTTEVLSLFDINFNN